MSSHSIPALPPTGERHLTEFNGEMVYEHLHRYALASNLSRGLVVVDVACGEGYGSHLLAQSAKWVFGIDVAEDAIAHARAKYLRPNLEFKCADAAHLPIADHSVDLVVSFETIEHLDGHDEFLSEIKRILKSDGRLFISSPDKANYSDKRRHKNPFHKSELYHDEFTRLIGRFFKHYVAARQHSRHYSVIAGAGAQSLVEIASDYNKISQHPWGENAFYSLILAGDQESLPITSSVFTTETLSRPEKTVIAQVFWSNDGNFSEINSCFQNYTPGRLSTLTFEIPHSESVAYLRIDPTDQPGEIYIENLEITNATNGNVLWSIKTLPAEKHSTLSLHGLVSADTEPDNQFTAVDDDPWLILAVKLSSDDAYRLQLTVRFELRQKSLPALLSQYQHWFSRLNASLNTYSAIDDTIREKRPDPSAPRDPSIYSPEPTDARVYSGEEAPPCSQISIEILEQSPPGSRLEEQLRHSAQVVEALLRDMGKINAELSRLANDALRSATAHKIDFGAIGQGEQPLPGNTSLFTLQRIIAATHLELGDLHGELDQARSIHLKNDRAITGLRGLLAESEAEKLRLQALVLHHANQHRLAEEKLILVHKTLRSIRRSWTFRLRKTFRSFTASPHSPGPRRFYFSIDLAPKSRSADNPFTLAGWFLDDTHRPARRLIARIGKNIIDLKRCPRPDLQKTFPKVDDQAGPVGFHHEVKTRPGWKIVSVEAETESGESVVIWRRLLLVGALDKHKRPFDYSTWLRALDQVCPPSQPPGDGPLISILMPVYNPPERWLRRAIESVRAQTYPRWQLCVGNDASTLPHVRAVLDSFAALDSRILVVHRPQNGHISAASNSALELCCGEFTALLDHDDELAPHALAEVVNALTSQPDASIIYSDEDKINEQGERFDPYFKPDWNPDLLLGQNTFCHLTAYRTSLLRAVGGFRPGFEGAQDWDVALRATEKVAPSTILHIPRILYHWRAIAGSTALNLDQKPYHLTAARRALVEAVERRGWAANVLQTEHGLWRVKFSLPSSPPLVTLIIPTRNRLEILRPCIESIVARTTYPNYEIIIVDNGSDDAATLAYLAELGTRDQKISVLRDDGPFNYSALNNRAAEHAKGELLALVNNDIEPINPDWLEEMCAQALRPEIGAVGALLYYPDNKVQHGGVVLGLAGPKQTEGIAGHAFKFYPRGHEGAMNRLRLVQNYTAVTAACLVVRKSVFIQVNGLNETDLAVSFNDVDFCLRLHRAGYLNLWTPFAELYHHESASRGKEDNPDKLDRAKREANYMRATWANLLDRDPAYNTNLTLVNEDFGLSWPPRL